MDIRTIGHVGPWVVTSCMGIYRDTQGRRSPQSYRGTRGVKGGMAQGHAGPLGCKGHT